MTAWRIAGFTAAERRARLERSKPFSEQLEALSQKPLACFHRETNDNDASYARADLCLDVGKELFDAFFNSETGYRGAYYMSPEIGLTANRELFAALTPALQNAATASHPELDRAWFSASISLTSAKAWLGEETKALCPKCNGGWSTSYVSELRIENDRWELADHPYAVWGRQAPELTKLRIFGGFVDDRGRELPVDRKRERAVEISRLGWS